MIWQAVYESTPRREVSVEVYEFGGVNSVDVDIISDELDDIDEVFDRLFEVNRESRAFVRFLESQFITPFSSNLVTPKGVNYESGGLPMDQIKIDLARDLLYLECFDDLNRFFYNLHDNALDGESLLHRLFRFLFAQNGNTVAGNLVNLSLHCRLNKFLGIIALESDPPASEGTGEVTNLKASLRLPKLERVILRCNCRSSGEHACKPKTTGPVLQDSQVAYVVTTEYCLPDSP